MNNPNLSRTLAGIGIIGLGVFAGLGSLGIINAIAIWERWWPLILIFIGLLSWINDRRNWIWPAFFVIFGVIGLIKTLGYDDNFNPFVLFWPGVLVAFGLTLLFKQRGVPHTDGSAQENIFTMFGGSESRNTSKDYRGGNITAILGGVELDLRQAEIKKDIVLNISVLMGGVDIKVPRGLVVANRMNAVLGGVENNADTVSETHAPTLTLTGTVSLGGVEVKY